MIIICDTEDYDHGHDTEDYHYNRETEDYDHHHDIEDHHHDCDHQPANLDVKRESLEMHRAAHLIVIIMVNHY